MARLSGYRALTVLAGSFVALALPACGGSSRAHTTSKARTRAATAPPDMITIPAPSLPLDQP